jgi:hypothetical protein
VCKHYGTIKNDIPSVISEDAQILMTNKEIYFGDIQFSKELHLTLRVNTAWYD